MISIKFNAIGLLKILLIVWGVLIISMLLLKYTNEQVGDIRCSEHQRRQNVKCPIIGKTIPPQNSAVIRVVCLSDTHGDHANVHIPRGDIFIHGGDIMNLAQKNWTGQVKDFDGWLKTLPHRHKILVPGNHDPLLDPNLRYGGLITEIVRLENAIVLAKDDVKVEGVTIAGLPHTPVPPDKKKSWPYGVTNDEQMANHLASLPAADIFVSHNPPWEIGSFNTRTWGEEGSKAILYHVLMTKPKVHMFGHTHQGRGVYHYKDLATVFINTAYEVGGVKSFINTAYEVGGVKAATAYEVGGVKAAVVVDLNRSNRAVEGVYMETDFHDQFKDVKS